MDYQFWVQTVSLVEGTASGAFTGSVLHDDPELWHCRRL